MANYIAFNVSIRGRILNIVPKFLLFVFFVLTVSTIGCADELAAVLLDKLWDVREIDEGLKVEFNYSSAQSGTFTCTVFQLGNKKRVDCISETIRQSVWVDEKFAWIYREGHDVVRTNRTYLADHGEFFFDVRDLGLSTVLAASSLDIRGALLRDRKFAKLSKSIQIKGLDCQVVAVTDGQRVVRYFVHEPTLRLFRVEAEIIGTDPPSNAVMECDFRTTSQPSWLPTSVTVKAKPQTDGDFEIMNMRSVGIPSPDDFELIAIGIPIGTAVVDYDQQFRLGYWTGSNIDEEFSGVTGVPASRAYTWWIAFAGAVFAIITLGLFRLNRK
jgi:hypothetical protein